MIAVFADDDVDADAEISGGVRSSSSGAGAAGKRPTGTEASGAGPGTLRGGGLVAPGNGEGS